MADNLQNLTARRDAIIAELAAMGVTKPGGLPDMGDGVQHVAYRQSLYAELREINGLIAIVEGPWEVQFTGVP